MGPRSGRLLVLAGAASLAAAALVWRETERAYGEARGHGGSAPLPASSPARGVEERGESPVPTTPALAVPPPVVPAERPTATLRPVLVSEESLMKRLRDLGETAPALSMDLARDGNDRFGRSDAAAERGWFVVKSLANLGRFDEARAAATLLVESYPRSSWAADVERHLLTNPLYPADD